jgi:hypothetical protein
MLSLLITLLVVVIIFAVAWWILSIAPIPPPFVWVVRVIFGLIFLVVLIEVLIGGLTIPIRHF